MLEAVLCILIIGGFFVFRAILATVFFFYLLPEGDRCPTVTRRRCACSRVDGTPASNVSHELVLRVRLARTAEEWPANADAPSSIAAAIARTTSAASVVRPAVVRSGRDGCSQRAAKTSTATPAAPVKIRRRRVRFMWMT